MLPSLLCIPSSITFLLITNEIYADSFTTHSDLAFATYFWTLETGREEQKKRSYEREECRIQNLDKDLFSYKLLIE